MLDFSFKKGHSKISVFEAALCGYKQDAADRLLCVGPGRNNPGSTVVYPLTVVDGDCVNPTREGDLHHEKDTSIMSFNTFTMSTTDVTS